MGSRNILSMQFVSVILVVRYNVVIKVSRHGYMNLGGITLSQVSGYL